MIPVELHQIVNGLQDKYSRLHSAFFQNNFYNILEVVSYRPNKMDRHGKVTGVFAHVAVYEFSKRLVNQLLDEKVVAMLP
jgi:hypothetical protein